jgi:hypothetical protein
MPLLLTLPYCQKDVALASKVLDWMIELSPLYAHSCLLVADDAVPHEQKRELQKKAHGAFYFAETINVRVPADRQGWPLGPNFMFTAAARQVAEAYKLPWLWFEPDAVPLVPTWLDRIESAYKLSPKRFLGTHIPSEGQPDVPPVHLSGCAVYAADAYLGLQPLITGKVPFDMAAAGYSVPRSTHTPLMQHYWGSQDLAPTFKEDPTPLDPKNTLPLSFLKAEAVMFHRCKDGSLIDLLRQKLNSPSVKSANAKKPSRSPAPARNAPREVAT